MIAARPCPMPKPPCSPAASAFPNPRPPSRQERVTATGWHVVGKAVSLVADESRAWELSAGRDEDVLFVARFRLRGEIEGARYE